MGRTYDDLNLKDIKIEPGVRFPPEPETDTRRAPSLQLETSVDRPPETLRTFPARAPHSTPHRDGAPAREEEGEEVLKVSAHSRPSAVAGAIAGVVRHQGRAEVQAIGAGATNQAIKAVAIARDYLAPDGIDIVCIPAFIDVTIANEERTAIRLVIESRG
ncbi:MAG TPA: stage V sporulation protein S [Chloroflexia bacterium]|nr:stage V sporulation protein S [Chloroflexia bacterium]